MRVVTRGLREPLPGAAPELSGRHAHRACYVAAMRVTRLRLGELAIDRLSFPGAIDAIDALVERRLGGMVVTPNVDHVVIAERNEPFRAAYAASDLCLADGMPVVWASRLLGAPLPEKISGSDLVIPLMARAASRGWRVFLLGGAHGVADAAAERLGRDLGVNVVGTAAPLVRVGPGEADPEGEAAVGAIRAARADVVLDLGRRPAVSVADHRLVLQVSHGGGLLTRREARVRAHHHEVRVAHELDRLQRAVGDRQNGERDVELSGLHAVRQDRGNVVRQVDAIGGHALVEPERERPRVQVADGADADLHGLGGAAQASAGSSKRWSTL